MVGGQDLLAVEEGEGQMERVSRPPDAALAVEDALDALFGDFAADVEMAEGKSAFPGDPEIADVAAALGRNVEGAVLEGEDSEAVRVARRFAEKLVLVVVGPDAQPGEGPGRADVGRHDVQGAARLELGYDSDVRRVEIAAGNGLSIVTGDVIGVGAGIVPVEPVPLFVGVALVEVIPVRIPAVAGVVHVLERRLRDDGLVRGRARIGRVAAVEGQHDAEEAPRVLFEQGGDVEVVARPAAGHGGIVRKADRLSPEVAPDPGQLFGPLEAVDLEELGHVAGVDLERGDLDALQVDGLDRHGQPVLARQDEPAADEADLGPDRLEGDRPVGAFLQAAVQVIADAGQDIDGHAAEELLGRIDPDDVALDLEGQRTLLDEDEPLEVLVPGQAVGETHQDVTGLSEDGLDGDDLEGAQGRHLDVAAPPVVDPDGGAVPRQVDRRGLLSPDDVLDREIVRQPLLGMAPLDRQPLPILFGLENLLDQGLLLHVGRDDAAAKDLGLRPLRVLGKEAFQNDLHVRPDDAEAELEAGKGLGQIEDLADIEDGLVVLAGLQFVFRGENELARARPLGRPVDRRRELEEAGRGLPRSPGVFDEEDAHGGLAEHRSRSIGADIAEPFFPGFGRGRLFRPAAGQPEDADGDKDRGHGLLGHGDPSPGNRSAGRAAAGEHPSGRLTRDGAKVKPVSSLAGPFYSIVWRPQSRQE